jgi:hypothetical protein
MFNAQSIDHIYRKGNIVIYSHQNLFFCLKNKAHFMAILSHIRLEMKIRMTDNQINGTIEYPKVNLIYLIYDTIMFDV